MDGLLRGQEMAEIIYMPIRHHSPACAWHVMRLVKERKPDCILVEGPENANALIPVMAHPETHAPFAVYYSYRDRKGYVSEEKEDYKCYYPFLDYSPELAALRAGTANRIPVRFIDLPYGEILIASAEGRGLRRNDEKNNYNDDYLLARSRYITLLCEKAGLQNFDELWEKYFELNGIYEETDTFIGHMLTYCRLSRESTPREELEAEGCLKREAYMAWQIQEAAKEYRRILVVTGGFHTPGLQELLGGFHTPGVQEDQKRQSEKKSGEKPQEEVSLSKDVVQYIQKIESGLRLAAKKKLVSGKIPSGDQGVYLMPYSMEAAASLNGYASGMPFPGFYQHVWEGLGEGCKRSFEETVLEGIVAVGRGVRKKDGLLSSYDEICAFSMAQGLSSLRNKKEPGVYELWDSVLSSFVKGEYNLSTDLPMRLLKEHLIGSGIGRLCEDASVPPVVEDFENQCKQYGLKITSTLEQELILDIFSKPKHRGASMFFSRMSFLRTGFCRKAKGPDLRQKKNRNLIRESWKYKWSSQVIAALIDVSVNGATVAEACVSLTLSRLKKECTAREGAALLTDAFEMGLEEQLEQIYDRLHQLLLEDEDFYSVAEALSYLMMLDEMTQLYQSELDIPPLIRICARKLITLLPAMTQVKEEQLGDCMKAMKTLYQLTGQEKYEEDRSLLCQALSQLLGKEPIHPGLDGCAQGILYGCGQMDLGAIEAAGRGYLIGTHDQLLKAASYFRGLFYTARDLVFIGDGLLRTLDGLIGRLSSEEFMELLPEFRLAFSYFTPRETDQIGEYVAGFYGKGRKDLFALEEVAPAVGEYGRKLDRYVRKMAELG